MSKAEILIYTSDYSVAAQATYKHIESPIGRRLMLPNVKKNGCLKLAIDGMTSDEMFLIRPIVIASYIRYIVGMNLT